MGPQQFWRNCTAISTAEDSPRKNQNRRIADRKRLPNRSPKSPTFPSRNIQNPRRPGRQNLFYSLQLRLPISTQTKFTEARYSSTMTATISFQTSYILVVYFCTPIFKQKFVSLFLYKNNSVKSL